MNALKKIFTSMPASFFAAVAVVQHIGPRSDSWWIEFLNEKSQLEISEANEKEELEKGHVYIAPPNYHLLIEKTKQFTLTIGERVNFARPSIDLLFESAADAYKKSLIGILLTGSNQDGAKGLKKIKETGGLTIVQDPLTAESPGMPESAIELFSPDHILTLDNIVKLLLKINHKQITHHSKQF